MISNGTKASVAKLLFAALLSCILSQGPLQAQVAIGTESPDASALLHLKASDKGLLPPVMSTTQRLAILSPADGLIVFDSTSHRYFFYNSTSSSWLKISVDPDDDTDTDTQNTLNSAYNEGGAGTGRLITASSGAVRISSSGSNTALEVNNTTQIGVDVQTTTSNAIYAKATTGDAVFAQATTGNGIQVEMAGTGRGVSVENAFPNAGDLIYGLFSGNSTSTQYATGGRAAYFELNNSANTKPALEARTSGMGHGLLGITGSFTSTLETIPASGTVGLSLSTDPRTGVFGQSTKHRGIWGKTNQKTSWGDGPLSFISAVYGQGEVITSGTPMATDIFFGTTGVVSSGAGIVGINRSQGHGVIGVTKGGASGGTQAGVWGAIQDGSWSSHSTEFPFVDGTNSKGLVGVLGQSKSTVAMWGESQTSIGVVGTTGPKMGTAQTGAFGKVGVLGFASDLSSHAAVFGQELASTSPTVLIRSNAVAPALQINNMGNGIGLEIEQPNEMLAGVLNTKRGLLLTHLGTGIGGEIRLDNPMNDEVGLIVSTLGTGKGASFTILDEMTNMSPVATFEHRGKGSAGEFRIIDSESINSSPALKVNTEGTGSALRVGGDNAMSTEPTLDVITTAGRMALFTTLNTTSTLPGVRISSSAKGHLLDIEGTNIGTDSKATLRVESNHGRAAHFDQKSLAVPAFAEGVLISDATLAPGHAGLRVTMPTATIPGLLAADLVGNVVVSGMLSVTGPLVAPAKAFRIDHPLDEKNQYLQHMSIETDEYLNIYTGNVTTGSDSLARIQLPEWMTALNEDFRYQLTIIDRTFAQAIIWEKIGADNAFVIKTNAANISLSWQVAGRRKDRWVRNHPLEVEVEKPSLEKGQLTNDPLLVPADQNQ